MTKDCLVKASVIIGCDTAANKVKSTKNYLVLLDSVRKSYFTCIYSVGVLVFKGPYNEFKSAVTDLNKLKDNISKLIDAWEQHNSKIDSLENTLVNRTETLLNDSISKILDQLEESGKTIEKVEREILETTSLDS